MKLLCLALITTLVCTLYSPYYQRCRVNHSRIDPDALPLEQLQVERISNYYSSHPNTVVPSPELEINYQQFDYFFIEYIDAGGSGQVYLVEEEHTGVGKIVKRYFKEKPWEFKRENYIMHKVGQSIEWAKNCGDHHCEPNQSNFSTLSIFPHKESIILRKLQFDAHQAPLIFYKILKALDQTHRAGIIHNDIKMGNIMVNSVGPNFKFYEAQLIDWNLASFYYKGVDLSNKRGTVCYYSPEQLFLTYHITPAVDVWALGVVMYIYYTDRKPFAFNCKNNNLRAVLSLVGGDKLLKMYKKYRYNNIANLNILSEIQKDSHKYPQKDLKNIKPETGAEAYTPELLEVFRRMLQPDPELRATPEELMKMPYFKKIKLLPPMYSMKTKKKEEGNLAPLKKEDH